MGLYIVDPKLYTKYKDEVLKRCASFQRSDKRAMSDREIADELGLDARDVTQIRCVAERDCYPIEMYQESMDFKRQAARDYAEKRKRA